MQKIISLICFLLGFSSMAMANNNPDDIVGTWLSADGKGHIQIFKEGNKYFGKIVWLKEPNEANGQPKMDKNNPEKSLQSKPLVGAVILHDFVFDKSEWNSGHIYDPQNGKDYKAYLRLKDANTLALRGYIGFSLLGRTEIWTRIKN